MNETSPFELNWSGKSYAKWQSAKLWCMNNPNKSMAIVTLHGTFTLSFTPSKSTKDLLGTDFNFISED